jgi:hypothetical protein
LTANSWCIICFKTRNAAAQAERFTWNNYGGDIQVTYGVDKKREQFATPKAIGSVFC